MVAPGAGILLAQCLHYPDILWDMLVLLTSPAPDKIGRQP